MMKLSKKVILILALVTLSTSATYASVDNCINMLNGSLKESIKSNLMNGSGNVIVRQCAGNYPYLYITLTNLDDSKNKISITHAVKEEKGYPLKSITDHALLQNATIAINGFKWHGDQGYKIGGYASGATGTVYSEGKLINKRSDGIETVIGFSERTHSGTEAKFFDIKNGDEILDGFKHNLDNTRSTIIDNGVTREGIKDDEYYTSSMGIGELDGIDVLVLLSSYNEKISKLGDHAEIFQTLGVTDAIRLDGNTATSLYVNKIHLNPLTKAQNTILYGDARKIMYALTVSPASEILQDSKIEFNNVNINKTANYGNSIYYSGDIISKHPLNSLVINVVKPDGTEILDGNYSLNDALSKDVSVYHFGADDYVDMLGKYKVSMIAKDSQGETSTKEFQIDVLPNIDSITLLPVKPVKGNNFEVEVKGKKLSSDISITIGTDDTQCTSIYKFEQEAKFTCFAFNSGNFRLRAYYKNNEYVLYQEQYDYIECQSGEVESESCSIIANGNNLKTKSCSSTGIWSAYTQCQIQCDSGYDLSGSECLITEQNIGITVNDISLSDDTLTAGQAFTVSATTSDTPHAIQIDFGNNSWVSMIGSGTNWSHTRSSGLQQGNKTIIIRIVDSTGNEVNRRQLNLTVTEAEEQNTPPVAKITSDNDLTSLTEGGSITLNGGTSSDEEGEIATYKWFEASNAGPQVLGTQSTITLTNLIVGTSEIFLEVTDQDGLTHSNQITFNVETNDIEPLEGTFFGAIADDGLATGWSYGYSTQEEALERALQECEGGSEPINTCKIISMFVDSCSTMSLSSGSLPPFIGYGLTQSIADADSLEKCSTGSGDSAEFCNILVSVCSTESNSYGIEP